MVGCRLLLGHSLGAVDSSRGYPCCSWPAVRRCRGRERTGGEEESGRRKALCLSPHVKGSSVQARQQQRGNLRAKLPCRY